MLYNEIFQNLKFLHILVVTFSFVRNAEEDESSWLCVLLAASALIAYFRRLFFFSFFSNGECHCGKIGSSSLCVLCLSVSPAFPKSRRQKWETVEKYDQCLPVMCAWNHRRLSQLLARKSQLGNHGNGRSPHEEDGSEPTCRGSYWFFDSHWRGFMRKTVTLPLCSTNGQPAWEHRLQTDDGEDISDQMARCLGNSSNVWI